jgi:alkanesulfonate monooxygenase SsuD/methylene tetrahydromethanopterin reductase-like flavin-dependent oxidoreductase (luciferase family)
MRFSIWPNLQQPWDEVTGIAGHAEATGWDGVYVADHFMGDGSGFGPPETPTMEATAAFAALAATVPRVRIGSLVLGMTYRHPAVLAN